MSKKERFPKTHIRVLKGGSQGYALVSITKHQAYKLEPWLVRMLHMWEDDNTRYVNLRIEARDELEAYTRFRKLWVGLPKKGQDNEQ